MEQKTPKDSTKLAGRNFKADDYNAADTLSSGLATTHEQVSDVYAEGDISAVIDHSKKQNSEEK